MAYTTVNKSTDYFNTKIYTGNGSAGNSITGVGFQPDFTWIKDRDNTRNHVLTDAVRGATKVINSNTDSSEGTDNTTLTAFGTDGFTLGDGTKVNGNSINFASWNWKANGQGSSNTDGSINTTYTSVNTTAGFSIVKWTGTAANATVGHGLGVAPKVIIVKNLADTTNWNVYHEGIGNTKSLYLNSDVAQQTYAPFWNNTTPTSSVFTVGSDGATNGSSDAMIAYCFAEKTGYSRFSTYIGNGASNNGTFIYCGFRPAFALFKEFESTNNWVIIDNKRIGYNSENYRLFPDLSQEESTTTGMVDFVSNGIKIMSNNNTINKANNTFILMAFGQSLVGSNNVPCTAR